MNINKTKSMRADIQTALNEIAKRYDSTTLEIGNITYGEDGFTTRITCKEGNREEQLQKEFNKTCRYFDFEAVDFMREVKDASGKFRLVGFKPRATKKPVMIQREGTEDIYSCSISYLKNRLV